MQYRALVLALGFAVGPATCSAQLGNYHNNPSTDIEDGIQPSISGVVRGVNGVPLHNIRIEVRSLGDATVLKTCLSDMNGSFRAANLRSGTYEVVAIDGINEAREQVSVRSNMTNVDLRINTHLRAARQTSISVAQLRVPDKARHLLEKARNAISKKHPEEAEKYLQSALIVAPDYADALTARAAWKMDNGQTELAVEDLDHAIKADPAYGPAYLLLGAVFNERGRFDEALRSLDRSTMLDPKSWQCAFEMAKAWLGKHDYQRALQQLNRAESLGGAPMLDAIHILRGYAFMGERRFNQASNEFEAYLTAEPKGEHVGTVRATMARIKTMMSQPSDSVPLPAVAGFFGNAH